jgi:exopolysaccharide biosynthesis protein
MLNRILLLFGSLSISMLSHSQIAWQNVSDQYGLESSPSIQLYRSNSKLDSAPNISFYTVIDMKDRKLGAFVDTSHKRRLTPSQFQKRNPNSLITVNCSFFEFIQNRNVNLIVQNGKMVAFDTPVVSRKGKDTLTYVHTLGSAFGISRSGKMDIVFNLNDSSFDMPYVTQSVVKPLIDSLPKLSPNDTRLTKLSKWKIDQAFGGGPVLIQNSATMISNNEERKFAGKAINDKHPRTAIGYTADGKMIILVVQGRMKGLAEGATLPQLASIMLDLGCVEAMNLDGGGSSCMLVNGKETIKPSDKEGQRPVPAVLTILKK